MITKERAERAKSKLLENADKINQHIAKVREIMESDFLAKWDGKAVNIRVARDLAARYGLEERQYRDGTTAFKDASWSIDYLPSPLHSWGHVLQVTVIKDWDFRIPILVNGNNIPQARGDRFNAEATKDAWEQVLTLQQSWADDEAEAAEYIDMAAQKYNEIEQKAVELLDAMNGQDRLGLRVLCAFGGDIYDRINTFRWNEQKKEV